MRLSSNSCEILEYNLKKCFFNLLPNSEKKNGTLNLIFELMDMNLYEYIRAQKAYLSNIKVADLMAKLLKAIEYIHRYSSISTSIYIN